MEKPTNPGPIKIGMGLTKHRQVKYLLRGKIESGGLAAHDALPSERELAREHKVSVETVRATLRELIAEGIIYRVERKGTFVAPPSKKHQILVVAKHPFQVHAWDTTVIPFFLGVQEEAGARHQTAFPMLVDSKRFLAELGDLALIYRDLSGVIFYRDLDVLLSARKILEKNKIPVLFYGSDAHGEILSSLHRMTYAEETIVDLGLRHLEQMGCRTFGFIGADHWVVQKRRLELYKTWLRSQGYVLEPEAVHIVGSPDLFLSSPEEDARLVKRFEKFRGKGYGIFAAGDCYAIGLMNAGLRAGWKFPNDFSMVGVDNVPTSAFLSTPLSSVDLPVQKDGGRCLQRLLEGSKGHEGIIRETSMPSVVERSSVWKSG